MLRGVTTLGPFIYKHITIVKKGISLSLFVGDLEVVHKEAKAEEVFQHFKGILGASEPCTASLDFN